MTFISKYELLGAVVCGENITKFGAVLLVALQSRPRNLQNVWVNTSYA